MNNMLAGIIGKAYLAKKYATDPRTIETLESIENISNDAALIVRQLLTFAHENIQQKNATPIVALLDEAVKTARLGISEDIEFETDFCSEILMVYCDPVEIQQVLINLINNARDALTGQRLRRISVSVKRKEWEECTHNHECAVCSTETAHIMIEDTGNGISEADMAYIFDPFFTTKEIGKGTGLGLSMAKGAVESHGGSIHVSSTIGTGTKFEICLPVTNQPSNQDDVKEEIIRASSKATILIIDDDAIVRKTLGQVLLNLGYRILYAENGEAGIHVYYEHAKQIALIITDVVMPLMDGPTAIEKTRQSRADLPVIFITGYSNESLHEDDLHNHIDAMIAKPFSVAHLSTEVHRLILADETTMTATRPRDDRKVSTKILN